VPGSIRASRFNLLLPLGAPPVNEGGRGAGSLSGHRLAPMSVFLGGGGVDRPVGARRPRSRRSLPRHRDLGPMIVLRRKIIDHTIRVGRDWPRKRRRRARFRPHARHRHPFVERYPCSGKKRYLSGGPWAQAPPEGRERTRVLLEGAGAPQAPGDARGKAGGGKGGIWVSRRFPRLGFDRVPPTRRGHFRTSPVSSS